MLDKTQVFTCFFKATNTVVSSYRTQGQRTQTILMLFTDLLLMSLRC